MEVGSLGIIGGMGPRATSFFYDKIIEKTEAELNQNHINMILLNHVTLPDRTEVLSKKDNELFLNAIAKDLVLLQNAGVSNIAIPCNTAHYFYDEMQKMTTVPIINMVKETIRVVADKYGAGSRIGLLATDGTLNNGVYSKACEKLELEFYKPNEKLQKQIMSIIYKVKSSLSVEASELETIIEELVQVFGCHGVIIACTELSCIRLRQNSKYCVDAMDVLVEQSILRSGKRLLAADLVLK